ncbi:MAG TPA: hypothetical protein VFI13_04630 [Gemmatimonadales bacterium]|nr:hypothetical protein [Gemmatimonadales bacterium]
MNLDARITDLDGPLPTIRWNWDDETDILSGAMAGARKGGGLTGTIELTDDEGSIAVVDVAGGRVQGLDIVVWPEVTEVTGLEAPEASRDGSIILPPRPSQPGIAAVEVDTTLSVAANPRHDTLHLRIGTKRQVEVVRVADRFLIEVDGKGRLAGFWLLNVPFGPEDDLV